MVSNAPAAKKPRRIRRIGDESKGQLRHRLILCGQWESFLEAREHYKAQGIPPKDAWWKAAKMFKPRREDLNDAGSFDYWERSKISRERWPQAMRLLKIAFDNERHRAWLFENLWNLEGAKPRHVPETWLWTLLEQLRRYSDVRLFFLDRCLMEGVEAQAGSHPKAQSSNSKVSRYASPTVRAAEVRGLNQCAREPLRPHGMKSSQRLRS